MDEHFEFESYLTLTKFNTVIIFFWKSFLFLFPNIHSWISSYIISRCFTVFFTDSSLSVYPLNIRILWGGGYLSLFTLSLCITPSQCHLLQ